MRKKKNISEDKSLKKLSVICQEKKRPKNLEKKILHEIYETSSNAHRSFPSFT